MTLESYAKTGFWAMLCFGLFIFLVNIYADINGAVFIIWDDIWFQPIVYNYAETNVLTHPFLSPVTENPSGILIWHGWLMPKITGMIQGWFGGLHGIAQAKFSSHLVAMLIFLSYSIYSYLRFGAAKTLFFVPIFLTLFLYQVGRPEIIASGLFLIFFWITGFAHSLRRSLLFAVCIALVCITSPVLAVYLSIITGIFLFSSDLPRLTSWQVILMQIIMVPTLVFVMTTLFTDIPAGQWFRGIFEHAQLIADRSDGLFFNYFIWLLQLPLMLLFLVLFVIWGLVQCRQSSKIEVWLGVITLVCIVYFTSVRVPPTIYNLAWLLPLVIFAHADKYSAKGLLRKARNVLLIWLSLGFAASAVFFNVLAFKNINEGVRAIDLLEVIDQLPVEGPFLSDGFSRAAKALLVPVLGNESFTDVATTAYYRITFQTFTGKKEPDVGFDECLITSTFHDLPSSILGVNIGYTRQDWAFAVIQMQDCS